jgi:hypothetical protein
LTLNRKLSEKIIFYQEIAVMGLNSVIFQQVRAIKKPGLKYLADISATRLSTGDPGGFPSHPRGWFSIIVYHSLYSIVDI